MRVFGSDAQQKMQRVAHWLWPLLEGRGDFGYEGRMVGLDGATLRDVPALASLARIQGASVSHYVPLDDEAALTEALVDAGLATDRWDQFIGGNPVLEAAAALVREAPLPEGYTLHRIGPATPDALLDALAETALSNGVLPPATPVMTGQTRDAVCLVLEAPDGGVAACAGAIMRNQPGSRFARASWWGMLATRPADRGLGLSLQLGARAALHMHERFGAATFYTGVRRDNAVSRHVCRKLGVDESGHACLAVLDPDVFGTSGYTR